MVGKRVRLPRARRVPRVAVALLVVLLLLSLLVVNFSMMNIRMSSTAFEGMEDSGISSQVDGSRYLQLVPPDTISAWGSREFLAVLGIPSIDNDERGRRRSLQRQTCWQYRGVATRSNNFTGELLPLYLLAPHQSSGEVLSKSVREEASRMHDVILLPTSDVAASTRKKVGEHGNWGWEAEVVMSRKTYLWFRFALYMFPNVSYIVKGDDDMFVRVPQYLADLSVMPRHHLYMGRANSFRRMWHREPLIYVNGYCITLSRDAAQAIVSYKPLQRLVNTPYSLWRFFEFLRLGMFHEDVMVGMTLKEGVKYKDLLTVDVRSCRFHNAGAGDIKKRIKSSSVVVHHISESQYYELLFIFPTNGSDPQPPDTIWALRNRLPVRWIRTMPLPPQNSREGLRQRFSDAAKSLAELYRDATYSYNVGYRDALLLVQRYALISAREDATSFNTFRVNSGANNVGNNGGGAGGGGGASGPGGITTFGGDEGAGGPCFSASIAANSSSQGRTQPSHSLDVKQLLWFIQNTLRHHEVLSSASRSLNRRRRRSCNSSSNRVNGVIAEGEANGSADNERNCLSDLGDSCSRRLRIRRFSPPQQRNGDRNELFLAGEGCVTPPLDVDSLLSEDDT